MSFGLVLGHNAGEQAHAFPLVVALHARGGDAGSALVHARGLFGKGPEIVAPQAARPCNPFQSNLRAEPGYSGFSWYLGDDPVRPEAASFGDALAQLDLLARDLTRPFVVVGDGQGAVLAVTLALHAPSGLVGVHGRGAALPLLDGWQLPVSSLSHMEFALFDLDAPARSQTASVLAQRGARFLRDVELTSLDTERWLRSLSVTNKSQPHA